MDIKNLENPDDLYGDRGFIKREEFVENNAQENDENMLGDDEEEVIEYVEEFSYGQIIHGEDNQYYVVMDEDTPDFDFEKLNNVRVVTNEDGEKTLLMENTQQREAIPDIFNEYQDVDNSYLEQPPSKRRPKPMMDANDVVDASSGVEMQLDAEFGGQMLNAPRFHANGKRHSRVYGEYKCPDCDQAFVNTARLERHLAVHQVFGSFLCPLCGKTYKYEYNLFYHWRRTCRDMNDLLSYEARKNMEVTNLRQLVEEFADKKAAIGPLEMGFSGRAGQQPVAVYHHRHQQQMEPVESDDDLAEAADMARVESGGPAGPARRVSQSRHHHDFFDVDEEQLLMLGAAEANAELDAEHQRMLNPSQPSANHSHRAAAQRLTQRDDDERRHVSDYDEDPPPALVCEEQRDVDEAAAMRAYGTRALSSVPREYAAPAAALMGECAEVAQTSHENMAAAEEGMYGVGVAMHSMDAEERYISRNTTQAIQCGECFRSFANIARLERHLAGAHSSYGTFHCHLCGSRFRYDYNLLYHIRRACPFAEAMIDADTREQLPAANLKRLVRTLASQDVVRLPADQLSAMTFNHKPDLGDAIVRQQMLRSLVPAHRSSALAGADDADAGAAPVVLVPPPSSYQPQTAKPGFPEGKKCPVCSIVFYGIHILARHLKMAHPAEYEVWAPQLEIENATETHRQERNEYDPEQYEEDLPPHIRPEANEIEFFHNF